MAKNTILASAQAAYKKGNKARSNARSKGVVTTQRPKQKKKKVKKAAAEKPKQQIQSRNRPSVSKASAKPSAKTQPQKTFAKPNATQKVTKQYQQYKKSSYVPKVTNTSKTALSSAQNAFNRGQSARNSLTKAGAVTTQAKRPKSNIISDFTKPKNYDRAKDLQKAYKKGSQTTYLGTKQKKTKTKIGADEAEAFKTGKKKNQYLESVNALTKGEMNRTMEASRYGKKKGDRLLKGSKRMGTKDIREKVGSKTAESAYKSKFATGAMQGMSRADIFSQSVGTYNKSASTAIKKTKDSKAYLAGYGVGLGADMAMGGIGTKGSSIAGAIGKSALRSGSKGASKKLSKDVAREAAREAAKITNKQSAKKFAKNRAGELAAETPVNVLDAAKMSMDEKGNIDKKEFRKWLAINTGATLGVGGAIEGIGRASAKKTSKKTMDLLAKQQAGTITAKESKKLGKNIDRLTQKTKGQNISGDLAHNTLIDVRESAKNARAEARAQKAKARVATRQAGKETAKQTQELLAKQQAGTITKTEEKTLAKNIKTLKASVKANDQTAYIADRAVKQIKKSAEEVRTNARMEKSQRLGKAKRASDTARAIKSEEDRIARMKSAKESADSLQKEASKLPDAKTLAAKRQDAERRLNDLKDLKESKAGRNVTTLDNSIANVKKEIENIKSQENTVWRADRGKRQAETIAKDIKKAQARVDDLKSIVKDLEKSADTPEAQAKLDLARQAQEKAETDLGKARKDSGRAVESGDVSTPSDKSKETKRLEKIANNAKTKYTTAKETLDRLDEEGGKLWNKLKAAKDVGSDEVDNLQYAYNANQRAQAEMRDTVNKLHADWGAKTKAYQDSMTYASVDDISDVLKETTGNKQIDDVIEAVSDAEKPKTGSKPPRNLDDQGRVDVRKNQKGLTGYRKVREALVDNFDSLEHIANHLPEPMRKKMLTQINELRRAQKTGRALVAEKGRQIWVDYGLAKRGAKAKAKRDDFEMYCFLKHGLDRKKTEKDFLPISRKEAEEKLKNLTLKYATNVKGNDVIAKNGKPTEYQITFKGDNYMLIHKDGGDVVDLPLKELEDLLDTELRNSKGTGFQQRMVKYFDDLLDREVKTGITSKEEATSFRKMYPNYVPTYKPSEFENVLKNRTIDEIDVGRGMKAATGGEHDLVPLYNQMQTKTNVVMKRVEMNKTLHLLCSASGTTKEELETLVPSFKTMAEDEKPQALLDTQIFTQQKNGQHIAVMYHDGEPIKLVIDEDVYNAIRRWSGEDRKFVTIAKLFDNPPSRAINAQFKKWITDYSLIFGMKNFKRDTATALFYTKDIKGYVKNFPKAMAVCFVPEKVLPANWKMYKDALQVYKENGGVISQFIARDSATPTFYQSANKFNPLKYVETFNSTLETVPRMAEWMSALDSKAMKLAGKEGNYDEAFKQVLKDPDAVSEAMYRAKDVTLNFDRSGYLGAAFNRGLVPFFNPAAQGLDKLGRTIIRDNIKYGKDGKVLWTNESGREFASKAERAQAFFKDTTAGSFMKMGVMLGGMVAVPTIAWNEMHITKDHTIEDYVNGEVEGYEKQNDYNRYTNYLLPVGDGKFLKIPKARELASIQAGIDWAMDNMKYGSGSKWDNLFSMESVRDWKSMTKIAREQIGPVSPFSDNIFSPVWRLYKNETWYGGKIESGHDLELREQGERSKIWDENTSALAKMIGKQFNISPKKVDNALDSYTGIIYDMGLSQTSAKNDIQGRFTKEGFGSGLKTALSSPFSQGFVIDSVFRNANKTDYYSYVDKRAKKLKGLKEGTDEYNEVYASMTKDKNAFAYTSSQYDELISNIYLDDKLTPTQKNYYARQLKKGDNAIWGDRKDGRVTSSRDPMADAWSLKDKKGKRVLSTEKIIDSCSFTFNNGGNNIKDAYTSYKEKGGKSDEKFMQVTLSARDVNRAAGEGLSSPRWETVAYATVLNHIDKSDKVLSSYIEKDTKRSHLLANARIFEEHGFNIKDYKNTRKIVTQGAYDLGYDYVRDMRDGETAMCLANARSKKGGKVRDGYYQAHDFYILDRMNSARWLDDKKNGIKTKDVKRLCDKYKLKHDDNYKWDIEKVSAAVEKEYGSKSAEFKAAMVQVITGCKDYINPYGSVGDYSLDNDTGIYTEGHGGYGRRRRRRGRRHYGRGGGGGGGKSSFTPVINTAGKNAKVTSDKVTNTSTKNTSSSSNLNDAYRKKVKKLREATRK